MSSETTVVDLLEDEDFFEEDDILPEIYVRLSEFSEDEVLIFDHLGRFVPVYSENIDELIESLQEYAGYFSIKNDRSRVDPIKLMEIQENFKIKKPSVIEETEEIVISTEEDTEEENE